MNKILFVSGYIQIILTISVNLIFTIWIGIIEKGGSFGFAYLSLFFLYWPTLFFLIPGIISIKRNVTIDNYRLVLLLLLNIVSIIWSIYNLFLPKAYWNKLLNYFIQ